MKTENIPAFSNETINVIIETPRGSKHKYTYEPEKEIFALSKTMPLGSTFPFDFGFIPNTIGEDGDPLDVLVLIDEPAFPGCLVECRVLGALIANQKERDGKETRNDRIVAVSNVSVMYKDVKKVKDLSGNIEKQIADFFVHYNEQAGKQFTPIEWCDAGDATKLIKEAQQKQ